ncbi:MAG TPA: type IX secretion system membrane protein PorP/SprF, partial [Flavobacterium sp.]|nr:type IX secretion system membrane protein PorP/SprF [Flavobacterium sp.]
TVRTSESFQLSFGVKGTANLLNLDPTKLNPETPLDPSLIGFENEFSPNVGAGIYWHSDRSYIGISVPNFIETKQYDDNEVAINQERLNYYFIAGHVFDLSPSIQFKPALLTKVVTGAPLQLDVSANFLINQRFTLGGAYRMNAAVSGMAGFQITDGLFIGYSYDMETTKLRNYNSGSHELFLRFELFSNHNRIISPRFF